MGSSLALRGDTLLIGTPNDRNGGAQTGAVSCYQRSGTQCDTVTELSAPGLLDGNNFGMSLALTGEIAMVGAPGVDNPGLLNHGAVFSYWRAGGS
ncbi:MAG: hypothetical protein ACI841_003498 [Planctomycetota bacterium]|jgi:hypothetical protein